MLAVPIIIGKGTVLVGERSAEANWYSRRALELDLHSYLCSGTDQLCGLGQVNLPESQFFQLSNGNNSRTYLTEKS